MCNNDKLSAAFIEEKEKKNTDTINAASITTELIQRVPRKKERKKNKQNKKSGGKNDGKIVIVLTMIAT